MKRQLRIKPENATAIVAALAAANGRATAHTVQTFPELEGLAKQAERRLEQVLPFEKDRPGAELTYRGEGAWAKAYGRAMTVSHIRLRRVRGAWVLLTAQTADAYPKQPAKLELMLTSEQAARAHALFARAFRVLPKSNPLSDTP